MPNVATLPEKEQGKYISKLVFQNSYIDVDLLTKMIMKRKNQKSIPKKDGLKLLKTLQQFELTGWEDKQDLKEFYDKLTTQQQKGSKSATKSPGVKKPKQLRIKKKLKTRA